MSKIKFTREYPMNASARMMYPYLNTGSGLSQWLCESAVQLGDRRYRLSWDNQDYLVDMTSPKANKSVRLTFVNNSKGEPEDDSYIELSIESSDLTQEHFLLITDYTDVGDDEELTELWDNLVQNLRELIGG